MTRVVRDALPCVLMLAVSPAAAFAQSLVCHPIRRGESATHVARRITGDSRNTYRASFQIMNPSSRFIPKSQYDRIRAGWRACFIKPAIQSTSSNADHVNAPEAPAASEAPGTSEVSMASAAPEAVAAAAALVTAEAVEVANDSPQSAVSGFLRTIGSVDLTMVWLGAAMVVPWVGWRIVDDYLVRRKTASIVMRHFASRFIQEFERPLVWYPAERPVRSQVRYSAWRGRLEILLAPGQGRRYPNLSDHKKNVEYDVARVVHVLADQSFVNAPLYTHDGWVVVPFQFKTGPKQPGVTCISSF